VNHKALFRTFHITLKPRIALVLCISRYSLYIVWKRPYRGIHFYHLPA